MVITIISILMIMLGYFLMLYGAVGFIQDKRLFSSAPKENLAVICKLNTEVALEKKAAGGTKFTYDDVWDAKTKELEARYKEQENAEMGRMKMWTF